MTAKEPVPSESHSLKNFNKIGSPLFQNNTTFISGKRIGIFYSPSISSCWFTNWLCCFAVFMPNGGKNKTKKRYTCDGFFRYIGVCYQMYNSHCYDGMLYEVLFNVKRKSSYVAYKQITLTITDCYNSGQ